MTQTGADADPAGDRSGAPFHDPFHDLDGYVALPRLGGLLMSPDGSRLVVGVATLDPKRAGYRTALWEVDPEGTRPSRRLTRGAEGESPAAFLPDGSLLFTSTRKDPDAEQPQDDAPAALWLLPAAGGEARPVVERPGGVSGVVVARTAGTVVFGSPTLPGADTADDDAARRKARKDAAVTAILHESYPVRYWDHDLGPARTRLFATDPPAGDAEPAWPPARDLTGHVGPALGDGSGWDVSPDGRTVVAVWVAPGAAGSQTFPLAAVDVGTGSHRILREVPDRAHAAPVISPDGRTVAVHEHHLPGASTPPDRRLLLVDIATGQAREPAPGWDRWPAGPVAWTPDGSAVIVPADEQGASPLFRVDVASGTVSRLTGDRGAYTDPHVSPDGAWVYALRLAVDAPPAPVRLRASGSGHAPEPLPAPAPTPELPGRLAEVEGTAVDGTPLRAWLAVPAGASATDPAPLLLWVHGGPLSSWNGWSWRWNPWLAVARGYAVLLPDPALSTGYGLEFIRRAWGDWGGAAFSDVLQITNAALAREDLDAGRTAMMGGSYGGYMANWIAGHTDRFRAIVSHASLWALEQFRPTTDDYAYWRREMTPRMLAANSPHRSVARITTPMLVIHGDRDYRVPVAEALRLWAELAEHHAGPDGTMPHKFLYFPDENHWVLKPQHTKVWYATVFAFLAATVLGEPWVVPEILR